MNISISDYRAKLMTKISGTSSREQVIRLLQTAISALKKQSVNGYLIARFVDRVMLDIKKTSNDNLIAFINLPETLEQLEGIKNSLHHQSVQQTAARKM
jgi:hypothetical protein